MSKGRGTLAIIRESVSKTGNISTVSETTEQDRLRTWVPEPLADELTVHHVSPDSDLGDKAEQFVYETYRASGFCQESPRHWVEEAEPWRDGSTLHVICDDSIVLGVLRTVVGEFGDLPASQFTPLMPMDGLLVEGGSLAVRPDHRGMGIANELHRIMFWTGITNRADGWVMLIDPWMADFLREFYVFPTHRFSESRRFMGGDIEPIVVWRDELIQRMVHLRPMLYKHAAATLTPQQIVEFDLPILLD